MNHTADLHIEKEILLTKMQEAISKLNVEQQQCVNLFYLQKTALK